MFLYRLFERQRGGILVDAMGLGKIVQSIAFLGTAYSNWDYGNLPRAFDVRVLVVSPASVRQHCKREFEMWSSFRVAFYDFQSQSHLSWDIRDRKDDVVITNVLLLIIPTFSKTCWQSTRITTTTTTQKTKMTTSCQGRQRKIIHGMLLSLMKSMFLRINTHRSLRH